MVLCRFVKPTNSLQMYKQSDIRDYEIKEIYFIVYRASIEEGKSSCDARYDAFSAIELRYSLSKSRSRNIIRGNIRNNNYIYAGLFAERLEQLKKLVEVIDNGIKQKRNR